MKNFNKLSLTTVTLVFFAVNGYSVEDFKITNTEISDTIQTNQNKQASVQDTAIIYTCPMHPEISWSKPDKCPKCGMDLVPKKTDQQIKVIYTCSMHPEVMSDKPGKCPKCGMDLVVKGSNSEMKMGCMGMMHPGGNKSHVWMYVAGGAMMVVMMTVMVLRFL